MIDGTTGAAYEEWEIARVQVHLTTQQSPNKRAIQKGMIKKVVVVVVVWKTKSA